MPQTNQLRKTSASKGKRKELPDEQGQNNYHPSVEMVILC